MKFICIARCPELDLDNTPHCTMVCKNDEELHNQLIENNCPCGNAEKWVVADEEYKHSIK